MISGVNEDTTNELKQILQTLSDRGGRIEWTNGKLMIYPKEVLDDILRAQMRARREELQNYAKLYCASLLDAVEEIFGDVLTDNQKLEDHLPATIMLPCWSRRNTCKAFSEKQLLSMTPTQLVKHDTSCGDCDIYKVQLIQRQNEQKRREEAEKSKRQWRTNHFSNHHEEED